MQRIQNASSQIPDQIRLAVGTVSQGTTEEAQTSLPSLLQNIVDPAKASVVAAQACQKTFEEIMRLARDIFLECTQKVRPLITVAAKWKI